MPEKRTRSAFFEAMASTESPHTRGPLQTAAIASDAGTVLGKASGLLGYQDYLTRARAWKAARGSAPSAFEREVQAHATNALADTHALATATLRMTSQFQRTGALDGMMSRWTAAVKTAKEVPLTDLQRELESASVRELLRAEGVADEVWTSVVDNLKQVDGRLFVKAGRLALEATSAPGSNQPRTIEFAESPKGMPQTLAELRRRGRFQRLAEQFERDGARKLHLLPRDNRPFEVQEVILGGAILGMQGIAQHRRGLQDAGLATYSGSAAVAIWIVAALAAAALGYLLASKYCEGDDSNQVLCKIGGILLILGLLALGIGLFGVVDLIVGPDDGSSGDMGCPGPGRVIIIDVLTGEVGCGPKSTGG